MTPLRRLWADVLREIDTPAVGFVAGLLFASLVCLAGTWLYGVSLVGGR